MSFFGKKHILLVGGGSGGHFYPLMALSDALMKSERDVVLTYMGPERYDAKALDERGIRYLSCPAGKSRRYRSFRNVLDLGVTVYGFFVALIRLYILYPDVVVSKGGYTSVPVILAAAFLRIPILIHESDTQPGRANRLASRFTEHVAISFEEARSQFPRHDVYFTGIPLRKELLIEEQRVRKEGDLPTLLVLGGSQGALRINELILDSLDELLPRYRIVHQTGKEHFTITKETALKLIRDDTMTERYIPIPFWDDATLLHHAYRDADLVISRAGTGTIYEIAAHGKPGILIPIPETISHDQRTNAYAYARRGAASVLEEANLSDSLLTSEISRIMDDPALYAHMCEQAKVTLPRDGAEKLATLTLTIADSHE